MSKEILHELEIEFAKIKKDLGFKTTLDQLDSVFFIRDEILNEGFVSNFLSRQICSRITNTYMNWNNYLHGLVFVNPGNMMLMTEARMFNDVDKKRMSSLISETMGLVSNNTLIGITKDKKKEAEFIDNALGFWNTKFKPEIEKVMKKVHDGWMKKD